MSPSPDKELHDGIVCHAGDCIVCRAFAMHPSAKAHYEVLLKDLEDRRDRDSISEAEDDRISEIMDGLWQELSYEEREVFL